MRALVIENNTLTAQSIEVMLKRNGFRADLVESGEEGLEMAKSYDYDVLLLDLKLDDVHGLEVLRELRNENIRTPVVILSGVGELDTRVEGLKIGADDYLGKPFHETELVARINAVVRRTSGYASSVIKSGPLAIDIDRGFATVNGDKLDLTASEFSILELLFLRKGGTVTKQSLLNKLYAGLDEPSEKIIDVFVHNLRKKIKALGGDGEQIVTVWGRGYMLEDRDSQESGDKGDG